MKQMSKSIDEHIADFPHETQVVLEHIRETIRMSAPLAEETINYGIPTFKFHGNLVHFAGYKKHIGFYPGASGIEKFSDELSGFKCSKGAVQFPITLSLPFELISRIVQFRVAENLDNLNARSAKKNKKS